MLLWLLFLSSLHAQRPKVIPELARLFDDRSDAAEAPPAAHFQRQQLRIVNGTSSFDLPQSREVCDCGVQQFVPHRIYGGSEAFPHEYPWMAALVFPPGSVSCGASLISPKFALTAAHCFIVMHVTSLFVVLGAHDLRYVAHTAIAVPARQVIVHPSFDRSSGDYDLALVEFAYPVQFGPNIGPVCLPFPEVPLLWQQVVVMGWGLTEIAPMSSTLQEVSLTVVPTEICQAQYTTSGPLTPRMLCAWGDGKDACRGDSGGPLVWNHRGRWYIAGVVSFGMACGASTASAAGVYTRVNAFLDWIRSETEGSACLAPADPQPPPTVPYPWIAAASRSTSALVTSASSTTSLAG